MMSCYQMQAIMSSNRTKTIINKAHNATLAEFVLPFTSETSVLEKV